MAMYYGRTECQLLLKLTVCVEGSYNGSGPLETLLAPVQWKRWEVRHTVSVDGDGIQTQPAASSPTVI